MQKIFAERPDTKDRLVFKDEAGNSSYTFMTKTEVFKAPLPSENAEKFRHEIKMQQALHDAGIPVPGITYVGQDHDFYGMVRVEGVILNDLVQPLSDGQVHVLARDLLNIQAEIAKAGELLQFDYLEKDPQKILQRDGMNKLCSLIRKHDVRAKFYNSDQIEKSISSYFNRVAARRPVFIHGDLHRGNIIVDPKTLKIKSIIDFGEARYTLQPEQEIYAIMWSGYNQLSEKFNDIYLKKQKIATAEQYDEYLKNVGRLQQFRNCHHTTALTAR